MFDRVLSAFLDLRRLNRKDSFRKPLRLHRKMKFFITGFFSKCYHICTYFPIFGLNTERYVISHRIQSECGKIRAELVRFIEEILNGKLHSLCSATQHLLKFNNGHTIVICEISSRLSIKTPKGHQ